MEDHDFLCNAAEEEVRCLTFWQLMASSIELHRHKTEKRYTLYWGVLLLECGFIATRAPLQNSGGQNLIKGYI